MNAAELIALLKTLPEDTEIVVPGYEGGCDAVQGLKTVNVVTPPESRDKIFGEYDFAPEGKPVAILFGQHGDGF